MKHWEKKEFVINLRQNGLSYREIRQNISFPISKSTLSNWCKDIKLTNGQKNRLDKICQGEIVGLS